MSARTFETVLAGRKLVIKTGHLAQFANGLLSGPLRRDCHLVQRDRISHTPSRH